jgi:hypothetical protein
MALRDELQKRIERKRSEMVALERQIGEARVYIQALEDTLKLVPRDGDEVVDAAKMLRTGSGVAKAKDALRRIGHPLHIVDLLKAMGRGDTRPNRIGLSGSIAAYVRKGEIFTRPAPNTYGLVEFASNGKKSPPPNFGIDEIGNEHQPEAGADLTG